MPPQYYSVIGQEYLGPAVLRSALSPQFDDKRAIRTGMVEVEWVMSGIVKEVGECELRRWRGGAEAVERMRWCGSGGVWVRNARSK